MNPYVANNLAPSLRGKKILLGITTLEECLRVIYAG